MRIELEINRPNGQIETVDVSKQFGMINTDILNKIRKATKEAGIGDVVKAVITEQKSNMMQLRKEYNNFHNEGGEGYIPDGDYFKALPSYKEWTETREVK